MGERVNVNITNVSRWFWEENPQEEWSLRDFPCLALPWHSALFRYELPKFLNNQGNANYIPKQAAGIPLAVHSIQEELSPDEQTTDVIRNDWAGELVSAYWNMPVKRGYAQTGLETQLREAEERPCRFVILHHLILKDTPIMSCTGYLDERGRNIGNLGAVPINMDFAPPEAKTDLSLFYPVFMAISLLHCKNVELIDEPISRQVRRQKERKGGIFYKTLVIEPFKKQAKNEAAEHRESEIHRALHICRGHFATYTEENPLFGRHVGTFWKPMHARGNKKHGEIKKDYKVKT